MFFVMWYRVPLMMIGIKLIRHFEQWILKFLLPVNFQIFNFVSPTQQCHVKCFGLDVLSLFMLLQYPPSQFVILCLNLMNVVLISFFFYLFSF